MLKKTELKTEWDLTLLYKSPKDPQIQRDVDQFVKRCNAFARKYKGDKNYVKTDTNLAKALAEYEKLEDSLNDGRPLLYFHIVAYLNSSDDYATAQISKLTDTLTKAENELTFFPLAIGKISETNQKKFLASKALKKYKYFLERRFLSAKYDLSESEENILNLTSLPASSLWVKGYSKYLEKQTVEFEGTQIPISEAQNKIADLDKKGRKTLFTNVINKLIETADFGESELNAIATNKKIVEGIRKLEKPYTSRLIAAENDEKSVLRLVDVTTKNFDIPHRFYKIKAKLLKQKILEYQDRSANVGELNKKYTLFDAYKVVFSALDKLSPEYSKVLNDMALEGRLDVYPRKGKSGGAFSMSSHNNPGLVLLNHVDNFNSVTTLGHELGHAIHSVLSATSQPIIYEDYSLSTAETASTFFESFVFDELIKDLSEKEKVIALHNKIQDDISTVFRQIAVFNFELDMHNLIREKGFLSHVELANLMNSHMIAYLGPAFKITTNDGYFYLSWSHIRRPFYVYTYAYGQLVSKALVSLVKSNPKNISKVKAFLSAGGSDTPENIFKSIGIDVTEESFWQNGLDEISKDIDELEKLVG